MVFLRSNLTGTNARTHTLRHQRNQIKGLSVMLNVAMTAQMHLRSSGDIAVSALPLPHVYGNVVMNGAVQYGMTLVSHAVFKADEILDPKVKSLKDLEGRLILYDFFAHW